MDASKSRANVYRLARAVPWPVKFEKRLSKGQACYRGFIPGRDFAVRQYQTVHGLVLEIHDLPPQRVVALHLGKVEYSEDPCAPPKAEYLVSFFTTQGTTLRPGVVEFHIPARDLENVLALQDRMHWTMHLDPPESDAPPG